MVAAGLAEPRLRISITRPTGPEAPIYRPPPLKPSPPVHGFGRKPEVPQPRPASEPQGALGDPIPPPSRRIPGLGRTREQIEAGPGPTNRPIAGVGRKLEPPTPVPPEGSPTPEPPLSPRIEGFRPQRPTNTPPPAPLRELPFDAEIPDEGDFVIKLR
jgi:hypothetical protein